MKKHLTKLMLLATILVLASCKKDPNDQLPDNPTLEVSKSEVIFNTPNDSTMTINVESNVNWVALKEGDEGADWLTVTPTEGKAGIDPTSVSITVTKNTTNEERVAAIHFRHNIGSKTKTVTVTQYPKLTALGADSMVLIELYNATNGWNWKSPWDIDSPVASWKGIKVVPRNGDLRVVEVNLENQEFVGVLPESIKNLTELTSFISYSNKIGTTLPLFFTQMPKLTNLTLGGSGFTGDIPEEYYAMTQLENLQLEMNKLTGGLSPKISQLKKLKNLSFGNCGLTGPIPATIGDMTELRDINLFGNNFEGDIPTEIGNIRTMELVRFDNNPKLTGGIPESFGQMDSLKVINISDNPGMQGPLPVSLKNCKVLWEVLISFSGTTGTIPTEWIEAKKLETFQAYNTQLSGELPKWDKHPSLLNLIIRNNVAGEDEKPYLYNNHFTGEIPKFVGFLEIFNARNCDFEGTLNAEIANTSSLQNFDISNSKKMSGVVPTSFWLRTSLVEIDLSGTGLSGVLPTNAEYEALGNPLSVQTMNIANCQFSGPIPPDLFNADVTPKINAVLLADNNFTGEVPETIAWADELQSLSLSGNQLSGVFPSVIKSNPGWQNIHMWNPAVNICPQQAGHGFDGTSCTDGVPAPAASRRR